MKKFTALALVAGLSATGAQAQYVLEYNADNGEVSIIADGPIINYVLESSASPFIPANHTAALFRLTTIPGVGTFPVPNANPTSEVNFLGESDNLADNQAGTYNLGNVLAPGLSEGQWNSLLDINSSYVAAVGTPVTEFQLSYVPEPTSLALLGLGGLLVARRRR